MAKRAYFCTITKHTAATRPSVGPPIPLIEEIAADRDQAALDSCEGPIHELLGLAVVHTPRQPCGPDIVHLAPDRLKLVFRFQAPVDLPGGLENVL